MEQVVKEDLLYYLWKTKSFEYRDLTTQDGLSVEIIHYGHQNHDSGPDFFDAKVKIGDTVWAGNVEMHVHSSDWDRHAHEVDPAYDNVILHVVYDHDKEVYTANERRLPCIELKDRIDKRIQKKYARLVTSKQWIPCEKILPEIDSGYIAMWLQRMISERLAQKTDYLSRIVESTGRDWEESTYIFLSRYMGAKVNTEPFETLARSLPLAILLKNKDDLHKIEALLFGQAGMLEGNHTDLYFKSLKKTYNFLSKKYGLNPLEPRYWKFAKMRPVGFPTIRIAQLAKIIYLTNHIFSTLISEKDTREIKRIFEIEASSFWDDHYRFGKESPHQVKKIGAGMIDLIIINVVAPIIFLYGKSIDNQEYCDRAIDHLDRVKPEKNKITEKFKSLGVQCKTAVDSQALIQLKKEYCDYKKCASCAIGSRILKK